MQKSRLLIFVIIGLLASNLLLAGYILSGKWHSARPAHQEGRPGMRGPRNLIIERLSFSDSQVLEYDKKIRWHRGEIEKAEARIMHLKNELYATLNGPANSAVRDSLIDAIANAQREIEHIHYKHFEDIRGLCNEQQRPAFEELTSEIASLFGRPPHKPRAR